jgi:spoIIIJ-associated protein
MGNPTTPPSQRSIEISLSAIENLLSQIIRHGGFSLSFTLKKFEVPADAADGPAYVMDFSGADQDLLLEKNGALLDALESVVFKAVRLDENLFGRISFDCRGWRQMRVEELKLMAQVAAERVIESGDPFPLNPMGARERRIIHLALKDQTKVRTQSEGFGPGRRVVIVSAAK